MASDNSDGEREAKRLRSSEPDLKVVLGGGDGAEIVQWHHSQDLAKKSNYIDALLAAPMREREERTISFPDISPDVWKKMLTFLDDPIAIRKMTPKDALEVAPFYDKYEFGEGRRLCDQVVADYFSKSNIRSLEKEYALDFDLVVDLVAVAHSANMEDSFKLGVSYIWRKMFIGGGDATYGRISFSAEHLTKLAPVLKYSLDNNERLELGLSDRVTNFAAHGTAGVPAVDDRTFPEKFVAKSKQWTEEQFVDRCVSHIELAGTMCKANGTYLANDGISSRSKIYHLHCEDPQWERDTWDGTPVTFAIQYVKDADFEGWAILRLFNPTSFDEEFGNPEYESFTKTKCWIAPCSANRSRPPLKGWVSADPKARGNPKIKYFLRRFVGGEGFL